MDKRTQSTSTQSYNHHVVVGFATLQPHGQMDSNGHIKMMLASQITRIDNFFGFLRLTLPFDQLDCSLRLNHKLIVQENQPSEDFVIVAQDLLNDVVPGQSTMALEYGFPPADLGSKGEVRDLETMRNNLV